MNLVQFIEQAEGKCGFLTERSTRGQGSVLPLWLSSQHGWTAIQIQQNVVTLTLEAKAATNHALLEFSSVFYHENAEISNFFIPSKSSKAFLFLP